MRVFIFMAMVANPCTGGGSSEEDQQDTGDVYINHTEPDASNELDPDAIQHLRHYFQSSSEGCAYFPCETSLRTYSDGLDEGKQQTIRVVWTSQDSFRRYNSARGDAFDVFRWDVDGVVLTQTCDTADCQTRTVYPEGLEWAPRRWAPGTAPVISGQVPMERYKDGYLVGKAQVKYQGSVGWTYWSVSEDDLFQAIMITHKREIAWEEGSYDYADSTWVETVFLTQGTPYAGTLVSLGGPLLEGKPHLSAPGSWYVFYGGE